MFKKAKTVLVDNFEMTSNEKLITKQGVALGVGGGVGMGLWSYVGSVAATGSMLAGYAAMSVVVSKVAVVGGVGMVVYGIGRPFIRGIKEGLNECECPCDPNHVGCSKCKPVVYVPPVV